MDNLSIREMLSYRRPAGSRTEMEFIERYIDTVPGVYADRYGNRLLIADGAKTMISCHTDTVHKLPGRQKVHKSRNGMLSLPWKSDSNCLGADDTAGVYAALRMIQAGVRGVSYVFHRAEEVGGKGSRWLADNYRDWLAGFNHCVALDRRGVGDVITHQGWGRTASDEFAAELCAALKMGHKPSSHGIFTDSANYEGVIPECTNVSVGYDMEHRSGEVLNVGYLERLVEGLIEVDWVGLGVYRDPLVVDKNDWEYGWYGWGSAGNKKAAGAGTNGAGAGTGMAVGMGSGGREREWWDDIEPLVWCMECGWEAYSERDVERVEVGEGVGLCPECGGDEIVIGDGGEGWDGGGMGESVEGMVERVMVEKVKEKERKENV